MIEIILTSIFSPNQSKCNFFQKKIKLPYTNPLLAWLSGTGGTHSGERLALAGHSEHSNLATVLAGVR